MAPACPHAARSSSRDPLKTQLFLPSTEPVAGHGVAMRKVSDERMGFNSRARRFANACACRNAPRFSPQARGLPAVRGCNSTSYVAGMQGGFSAVVFALLGFTLFPGVLAVDTPDRTVHRVDVYFCDSAFARPYDFK